MKVHPLYHFMGMILLALYGFLALIAYWGFWPYPTVTFIDVPATGAPVLNSPLHPGERLQYTLSYCKNTNDTATVHRNMVDGETIALTDTVGSFPKGCRYNVIVATTVVPDTINPGSYHVDVIDEFHPNPIRTIQVRYRTADFKVIPEPVTVRVEINGLPAIIKVKSATTTKP